MFSALNRLQSSAWPGVLIATLLAGFIITACNTEPEIEHRIDLYLADSLSADKGKYSSLTISILDTSGQIIRPNIFSGAYYAKPTGGILKGLVLGDSVPKAYVVDIRAFEGESEKVRVQIKVAGDAVSPIVRVYTEPNPISDPHQNGGSDTLPTGIGITETEMNFALGDASRALSAKIKPESARAQVIWSSSNNGVVTISSEGVVSPHDTGSAKVYATVAGYAHLKDSVVIHVAIPFTLNKLAIQRTVPVLFTGGPAHQILITHEPSDQIPIVTWNSSDSTTVKVSADGLVTGLKAGQALITVMATLSPSGTNPVFDTLTVTVKKDAPVLTVSTNQAVDVGQVVTFNLGVTQEYGAITLSWDFTGDGLPEGSATTDTATAKHTYAAAGNYEVAFTATDSEGNKVQVIRRVRVGKQGPFIVITSPKQDTVVNTPQITVRYTSDGDPKAETFNLTSGPNTLWAKATNALGTDSVAVRVTLDTIPPTAPTFDTTKTTVSPSQAKRPTWAWSRGMGGMGIFRWGLNTTPAILREDTSKSYKPTADLEDGSYTLTVAERDSAGNWSAPISKTITVDTKAPVVKILSPTPNAWVRNDSIVVLWSVDDKIQATGNSEIFNREGFIWIKRSSRDSAGNMGQDSVRIRRDVTPPDIKITSPRDSFVTSKSQMTIEWTVDGVAQPAILKNLPAEGVNELTVSQTDSAGNQGDASMKVFRRTKVIFVQSGKTGGDGTSWETAFGNLGVVLDTNKNYEQGTQVWVAEGEYEPTHVAGPDHRYLFLRSNLELYGGFKSGMTSLSNRNWGTNPTIITGRDRWGDIILSFFYKPVKNVIIDGFQFKNTWGAISLDSVFNVTIRNCIFDGTGTNGSRALLLTESSVWISYCKFVNHRHSPPDSGDAYAVHLFGGTYTFESDTVMNSDVALKMWRANNTTITRSRFINNGKTQSNGTQVLPIQLSATDTLRIFSSAVQGGETSILKEAGALVEFGTDNYSP